MQGSKRDGLELGLEQVSSPLGDLLVYSTRRAVCALDFADLAPVVERRLQRRYGHFTAVPHPVSEVGRRLVDYFQGDLSALENCPIDPGGTPFQRSVWEAMRRVAAGDRKTYAWLADTVGRPRSVRAVGGASSRNPIALLIPCHRIVGVDGSLVGYAGGVQRKRWLLEHEHSARTALRD